MMRITIDVEGANVRREEESQGEVERKQDQPRLEDLDAGPPPQDLIEMLAMEGALAPIMTSFQPLGEIEATSAGAPSAGPVRGTWESSTLVRRRRD